MTRKINKNVKNVKKMMADISTMPELCPIEETWEKMMTVNVAEIDGACAIAGRWDNFMNIRDLCYKVLGNYLDDALMLDERMGLFHEMHQLSIDTYAEIAKRVRTWSLEEFLKEEMPDYFEDMFRDPKEANTERDLIEGTVIFLTVKPWGEKMVQLHQQILFEQAQREAMAKGVGE